MFHKILVCSDGSSCALDAARTAAAIARIFSSEILALNVFHTPAADPAEFGLWAIAIEQEALERSASEQLQSIEQGIRPLFEPLETPWRSIQEWGHPVDTILLVAEREKVDLIVVGSRGLRGVKELLLGSVSSGILHHAACPVLIVRGYNAPDGTLEFDDIVLASDGSPCAEKAAKVAVELARKCAAPLTVLNVYDDLSSVSIPGDDDRLISDTDTELHAKQWLDYVARPVREFAKEAGVAWSYVQGRGHPDETIVNFANMREADLIVVGSRGLGGYARMLIGSVSNRVVHHANCPVLVVR